MPPDIGYATQFLKDQARDRYLASLVVPERHRWAIVALYAFATDCASVSDRVSEPAPGEIRLQWWADALAGSGRGAVAQNPLAAALLSAVEAYRLPTEPLLRLVNARRFDLYHDPMPDLASFEGYAGETTAVLYQLGGMILNEGEALASGDAAGHLGVAEALAGHLLALGFNASRGRVMLPLSIFAAHGSGEGEILAGHASAGVIGACAQLVELAEQHRAKAAEAIRQLPQAVRPAFAAKALLELQLKRVKMNAETPFAQPPGPSDLRKLAALVLEVWRRR